jgi:hypothetical protein
LIPVNRSAVLTTNRSNCLITATGLITVVFRVTASEVSRSRRCNTMRSEWSRNIDHRKYSILSWEHSCRDYVCSISLYPWQREKIRPQFIGFFDKNEIISSI